MSKGELVIQPQSPGERSGMILLRGMWVELKS